MIILKFDGGDADQHRIEALTGGQSLQGLGHALTLIAHFASTGEVRQRAPYSKSAKFYFSANREGSLEWLIEFGQSHQTEILIGLGVNGVSALATYVLAKVIGQNAEPEGAPLKALEDERSGDLEALIDAVEPSIRQAHRAVGNTVNNILIINGSNNNVMVKYDSVSKAYLETDIEDKTLTQDVSIASLNVNSKYGRAYFFDIGKTVPYRVHKDANPRTLTQLSKALDNYAKKNGATVNITFTKIIANDDRLKRIVIHDAWHLEANAA
jgi:hypothetical protein